MGRLGIALACCVCGVVGGVIGYVKGRSSMGKEIEKAKVEFDVEGKKLAREVTADLKKKMSEFKVELQEEYRQKTEALKSELKQA